MDKPVVIVVGAGPAGTRAAQTLTQAGLRPIVLDENRQQGGQIYRRQPENFVRPASKLYGASARSATALHTAFAELLPHIEYRPETLAWGVVDQQVLVEHNQRVEAIPYDALIIATGATDRIMPCPGWTLPGVFTLGGARSRSKHRPAPLVQPQSLWARGHFCIWWRGSTSRLASSHGRCWTRHPSKHVLKACVACATDPPYWHRVCVIWPRSCVLAWPCMPVSSPCA